MAVVAPAGSTTGVDALKSSAESKVEALSLDSVQDNLGCNQHPNVAGQQGMGTTLAARLHTLLADRAAGGFPAAAGDRTTMKRPVSGHRIGAKAVRARARTGR